MMMTVVVTFEADVSPKFADGLGGSKSFQQINGIINLIEDDRRIEVGNLEAHLFILGELGGRALETYDAVADGHLIELFERFFNIEEERPKGDVMEALGRHADEAPLIYAHLNVHRLYVAPEHRGRRYGLEALNALRLFTRRIDLLVTALAAPQENRDTETSRKDAVMSLAKYYQSDPDLNFKPYGDPADGYLVTVWE